MNAEEQGKGRPSGEVIRGIKETKGTSKGQSKWSSESQVVLRRKLEWRASPHGGRWGHWCAEMGPHSLMDSGRLQGEA